MATTDVAAGRFSVPPMPPGPCGTTHPCGSRRRVRGMPLNHTYKDGRWTNDRVDRTDISDTQAVNTTLSSLPARGGIAARRGDGIRSDAVETVTYQVRLPGRGTTRVWDCA